MHAHRVRLFLKEQDLYVCLSMHIYIHTQSCHVSFTGLELMNFLLLPLLFRKNAWFLCFCGVYVEAGVDTVMLIY